MEHYEDRRDVLNVNVEVVLDARATLAEGPIWDSRVACLRWLDIPVCQVHEFDPATGKDEYFTAAERVGSVAARRAGGLVLATESGFVTCGVDGSQPTLVHRVDTDPPGGRLNDGKADRWGRFWAGTMMAGTPKAGALYRLDPDGSLHTMVTGVSVSNGLGWSPDGSKMYYVDTPTGGVDVFDHDPETRAVSRRRRLIDITRGRPDGLTVDADGCIWVGLFNGWAIQRITPDGRCDMTIEVPAQYVTSCGFGGNDLATLYITTGRRQLTATELADQPHAGAIFALDPGVKGQQPQEWWG